MRQSGTMKEMEEKLAGYELLPRKQGLSHQPSSMWTVITDGCAMVKGEQLVLSRARKKEFMEELDKILGRGYQMMDTYYAGYTKNLHSGRRVDGMHVIYPAGQKEIPKMADSRYYGGCASDTECVFGRNG